MSLFVRNEFMKLKRLNLCYFLSKLFAIPCKWNRSSDYERKYRLE